jgi:hypothetical protein
MAQQRPAREPARIPILGADEICSLRVMAAYACALISLSAVKGKKHRYLSQQIHNRCRAGLDDMPILAMTRLRLKSIRLIPRFISANERAVAQLRTAPGFLRGKLLAELNLAMWTGLVMALGREHASILSEWGPQNAHVQTEGFCVRGNSRTHQL